jgi:NADH-quinone oxidoreductase subunit G
VESIASSRTCSEASASKLLVLHTAASRVGAMDLGCVTEGGVAAVLGAEVVYNLGADEIDVPAGPFVIYQGSHGDRGAHRADVILPGAAFSEKAGSYVNTEGRVQLGNRAGFPPGDAREDWAILRALSDPLGVRLPFDSLQQLRQQLYAAYPHFASIDMVEAADTAGLHTLAGIGGETSRALFRSAVDDLYLTNPIARASAIMAECSALARGALPLAAE